MIDRATLPYRPCAGVMLANRDGLVFVGQRLDTSSEAWQMPQGGIDPGEDAEEAATATSTSPPSTRNFEPGNGPN